MVPIGTGKVCVHVEFDLGRENSIFTGHNTIFVFTKDFDQFHYQKEAKKHCEAVELFRGIRFYFPGVSRCLFEQLGSCKNLIQKY